MEKFYGYPETHLRYKTWDLLRSLCRLRGESWLVMGDLNEILFHHEKMGDCEEIIKAQWGRTTTQSTMVDVVGMIRECGLKLDAWNRTTFVHVQKKLQQAKQQLNQLYEGDCGSDVSVLHKAREEHRKEVERIGWCEFRMIEDSGKRVRMNEALCREYTQVEVKDVLQQMHPSKAPGPDGMSPIVFQKYWHVVGRSVIANVLHALNSGSFASTLNHTFITLIPKKKTPIRVVDYRPISLCNVVYKLVVKVLANSGNVLRGVQEGIKQMWGNSDVQQYEKYLGLPPIVGRSRANAFRSIKQRVWQKLQAWKEKLLSQGGKEVLLKDVALSIPSYSMSCFLLPSSLCAELEGMMARFWWGQRKDERRIHWLSWDKMCVRKASGGLGFKNLRVFNLAMLATQGWRLLKEENSLLHRLLKAKYFSGSDFLQAGLGRSPSYTWRGIWEAKKRVLEGCRWRIGVGTAVNIWFDNWILGHNALVKEGYVVSEGNQNECVNSLMCENSRLWDFGKLRALFNPRVVEDIQKIVLCDGNGADRRIWGHERNGVFSVRSCYKFIMAQQTSQVVESSSSRV
ncbi:hypothetical protein Pint_05294 [Pistacia integerrima]|uniref:Uncharacterized protein n=1 Tax=Pistacia integerrima TaxID=434235 RepID=A0ACC0Z532_9ROSI|nr:hypothetical protein Pint_05294 [Pistacia integerrima]